MRLPYPYDDLGSLQPKTLATLLGSVAIVIVSTLALIIGAPRSIAVQATRVVAQPTARAVVTVETPRPAARVLASEVFSDSCPGLNNPGGRISWIPSANAGPWATDGTVEIPALGTTAPVVRVGVDLTRQMVVPPGAHQVAWLDQGGIPGRTNNMVLAGHISWAGVPGAFGGIGQLRSGDMVFFTINHQRMTFRVSWVCSFIRSSNLAPRIMGYTTVPSVTLITCGGGWDSYAGTHTNRIVARAELVSSEPA